MRAQPERGEDRLLTRFLRDPRGLRQRAWRGRRIGWKRRIPSSGPHAHGSWHGVPHARGGAAPPRRAAGHLAEPRGDQVTPPRCDRTGVTLTEMADLGWTADTRPPCGPHFTRSAPPWPFARPPHGSAPDMGPAHPSGPRAPIPERARGRARGWPLPAGVLLHVSLARPPDDAASTSPSSNRRVLPEDAEHLMSPPRRGAMPRDGPCACAGTGGPRKRRAATRRT